MTRVLFSPLVCATLSVLSLFPASWNPTCSLSPGFLYCIWPRDLDPAQLLAPHSCLFIVRWWFSPQCPSPLKFPWICCSSVFWPLGLSSSLLLRFSSSQSLISS